MINKISMIHFGNRSNQPYHRQEFEAFDNQEKLLTIYDMLTEIQENQQILAKNQQSIQQLNYDSFNSYYRDFGFSKSDIDKSYYDNTIELIG